MMNTAQNDSMPNGTHGCRYCDGFLRAGALYCSASCNTRLLESRNFVVVPTVGMIVPGWLLLLTKEHVPNMATIPASWHAEMSDLLRQAKALLSRHLSPPFVFEHRADPKHKVNCGSCVDHAHLHLIPSTHHAQIETDILAAHEFFSVPDLNKLSDLRFGDTGYLYYESIAGQAYACPEANAPRQFIRRIVAAHTGRPDRWNWAVFPEMDNIRLTLNVLEKGDMP
jgi:diadenosine tetraphosphate (Ap4A) HIT family hydrolase